jgi:hypothetical protein
MGSTRFDAAGLADVAAFRSQFHLAPNVPQVVYDPNYPVSPVTDSSEAYLDIESAGAIARNAKILFVSSNSFLHTVLYTVDNNLARVITMSANAGCETANTPANMSFYQAAARVPSLSLACPARKETSRASISGLAVTLYRPSGPHIHPRAGCRGWCRTILNQPIRRASRDA